jgi:hypothetical protein
MAPLWALPYPDPRGGPDYTFCYLVTAKHVLRDFDEELLRKVRVRLNLQGDDPGVEFDKDVPVSDENGKLLWFASEDEAVDLAVLPFYLCCPTGRSLTLRRYRYRCTLTMRHSNRSLFPRETVYIS